MANGNISVAFVYFGRENKVSLMFFLLLLYCEHPGTWNAFAFSNSACVLMLELFLLYPMDAMLTVRACSHHVRYKVPIGSRKQEEINADSVQL